MDYLKENLKSHLTINLDEKEAATLLAASFSYVIIKVQKIPIKTHTIL